MENDQSTSKDQVSIVLIGPDGKVKKTVLGEKVK